MINQILALVLVLVILVLGYYWLGLFILRLLKIKFGVIEKSLIALFLGISILIGSIAFLGHFIGLKSYNLLFVIILAGLIDSKNIVKEFAEIMKVVVRNKLGVFFLLIGVLLFSSTMILGGINKNGELQLQEVHDTTWHIALIENLEKNIPPAHPSDGTIILENYHYFYDLFLASFSNFSWIFSLSPFVLYNQYSVIFLSSILILAAYILGNNLSGKFSGNLLTGFTILAGSFAYLIPYFNEIQSWHESSFWVSQTFIMIVNPQVIYTLALTYIFIFLLLLLQKITPSHKDYINLNLLIVLLLATSIGFKSYSWIILSFIYAIFLLIELLKYRSVKTLIVGITHIIFSTPFVWLITKFETGSFFYEPLWFTNTMIESPDRVNYLQWKFLQDHYIFKKNWLGLYVLEAKKILIFYFGNLGVRSIFIFLPFLYFFKRKISPISKYVFAGFLFSSILPLLFLQRGTIWNSIQFWYYALIFANILAVIFLSELLKRAPKIVMTAVIITLFFLAIPTTIKTFQDKSTNLFTLGSEELYQLKYLSNRKIMICPEGSEFYHSSMIKTLTDAEISFANPGQLSLVGADETKQVEYEEIFNNQDSQKLKDYIENNKITTIICTNEHYSVIILKMLEVAYKDLPTKVEPEYVGSMFMIDWKPSAGPVLN